MSNEWERNAAPAESRAGAIIRQLESAGQPVLAPRGPRDARLQAELNAMTGVDLFTGHEVRVMSDAEAYRSGLLLWNDCLEDSHAVSQQIHTTTGSYWHGIMHRREPDYGNAKYWFRKVGSHAIFPDLLLATRTIVHGSGVAAAEALVAGGAWDPFAMVDACQQAAAGKDPQLTDLLERIQLAEFRLLLNYGWTQAQG